MFSPGYWATMLVLVLLHAVAGRRLQRLLLIAGTAWVYAAVSVETAIALAGVIVATWLGVRARHYTDDPAMLRFTGAISTVLAFVPLIVLRIADDTVSLASSSLTTMSVIDDGWSIGSLVPFGIAIATLQGIEAVHEDRHLGQRATFLDHVALVGFLPILAVGPVQRHQDLAPQLRTRRRLTLADIDRAALAILFGCFWKLVVADNLLPIADQAFDRAGSATGTAVVLGVLAFAVAAIADLAGHSAIAIGLARLFGVRLLTGNVDRAYLARSPLEWWERWLLSVGDWFRRRVYVPLSGGRRSGIGVTFAFVATFALGTLWFADRLNVAVWGLLHMVAAGGQLLLRSRRPPSTSSVVNVAKLLMTFGFVSYTWVWFRALSVSDALRLHLRLMSPGLTSSAVGVAFSIALFAGMLVVSDVLYQRLTDSPAPNAIDAPAARGLAIAGMVAALLVLTTADLHPPVLGER